MSDRAFANLPVDAVCPVCNVRLTATNTQKVLDPGEPDVSTLMCRLCNPWKLLEVP
jgi:hypothetical protein